MAERTVPEVALDRSSPVPLYFQVAVRMQQLIEEGVLPVGSRLENEVELAERLGVSRPTMRRAIAYLVERGIDANFGEYLMKLAADKEQRECVLEIRLLVCDVSSPNATSC